MTLLREQKRLLRQRYNLRRKAMPHETWQHLSQAIFKALTEAPCFITAPRLLLYLSSKDNEVDTHAILNAALSAGKEVFVPLTQSDPPRLIWSRLRHTDTLHRNTFGILEPAPGTAELVPTPAEGLCVTPGLAFTRNGARLGYGGGYYDRFLEHFRGVSVGLAFELQLAASLPQSPHDQGVNHVLTEKQWYPAAPEC
ncbi:MAG: 5-formyltetrahydrofolate cyclo-ligase [Candidatus Hydrogenedentes bacterium]|jgi:5-formyltetrahydrofolate cyclo-ligase|nr:5-formyltetrahydrofolate cyclo-ligase [Candidatus Hydrogenedentota bacterium]